MGSFFLDVSNWQVLAAIGIILAIAEIFVSGFVLLPMGLAFLLTAVVAVFVDNWVLLLFILAILEVGVFIYFRKRIRKKSKLSTNAAGMVGQECKVIENIPADGMGYVKLYGDEWQARSTTREAIPSGAHVRIVGIEGNKVIVEPIQITKEEK